MIEKTWKDTILSPKILAITTSAGVITILALVICEHYPKGYYSWGKGRNHTFRHAVVYDEYNSMNCMSGPWNECELAKRRGKRR